MTEGLGVRLAKTLIKVSTDSGADDSFGNVVVIPLREAVSALYATVWPEEPEAPGLRLARILDDKNISQAAFARAFGVSGKYLCQLISGKATLSYGMAIRLETATGVPAAEWNIAEAAWQDRLLRQHLREVSDHD